MTKNGMIRMTENTHATGAGHMAKEHQKKKRKSSSSLPPLPNLILWVTPPSLCQLIIIDKRREFVSWWWWLKWTTRVVRFNSKRTTCCKFFFCIRWNILHRCCILFLWQLIYVANCHIHSLHRSPEIFTTNRTFLWWRHGADEEEETV